MGEGQGLLRGEGRGEDPGPEPTAGCRCWGRISSTSSSTSPSTNGITVNTCYSVSLGNDQHFLVTLTFHIIIIITHVCVLCEQGRAGRGGDASTDPLHAHLVLQALDPAGALETDVDHFAEDLQYCGDADNIKTLAGIKLIKKNYICRCLRDIRMVKTFGPLNFKDSYRQTRLWKIVMSFGMSYRGGAERQSSKSGVTFQESHPHLLLNKPA